MPRGQIKRLEALLAKFKAQSPPEEQLSQVCEYTNDAINQASGSLAVLQDLSLDNVTRVETRLGDPSSPIPAITSLSAEFIKAVQEALSAHMRALAAEYLETLNASATLQQPLECKAQLDAIADSVSISNDLNTLLKEFIESTLLLKAVSAGERIIREMEKATGIEETLKDLADEIESQVLGDGDSEAKNDDTPDDDAAAKTLSSPPPRPPRTDTSMDTAAAPRPPARPPRGGSTSDNAEAPPLPPPRASAQQTSQPDLSAVKTPPRAPRHKKDVGDPDAPRTSMEDATLQDGASLATTPTPSLQTGMNTAPPRPARPAVAPRESDSADLDQEDSAQQPVGNVALMANLNRMLSGGPPPSKHGVKAEYENDAPSPVHSPSRNPYEPMTAEPEDGAPDGHPEQSKPAPGVEVQEEQMAEEDLGVKEAARESFERPRSGPPPVPVRTSKTNLATADSGSGNTLVCLNPSIYMQLQQLYEQAAPLTQEGKAAKKKGLKSLFGFSKKSGSSAAARSSSKHSVSEEQAAKSSVDDISRGSMVDLNPDPLSPTVSDDARASATSARGGLFHEEPAARVSFDEVSAGSEPVLPPRPVPPARKPTSPHVSNSDMTSADTSAPTLPPRVKPPVPIRSHSTPGSEERMNSQARLADEHEASSPLGSGSIADVATPQSASSPQLALEQHEEHQPSPTEVSPPRRKIPGLVAIPGMPGLPMGGLPPKLKPRPANTQSTEQVAHPAAESMHTPPRPPVPGKPRSTVDSTGELDSETPGLATGADTDSTAPPRPPVSHHQHPVIAPRTSPPLTIKKVANSTSGDDRALEKNAIEWLNAHLSALEEEPDSVDSLFNGTLTDGVKLIRALEHATGESAGKYRKKCVMQVHKVDNIAVALNFLNKRGLATQHFLNPQDIFNEDRGKILSLFNLVLRKKEWQPARD